MRKKAPITHVGFSDESCWNSGRYRSLGLVTLSIESLDDLQEDLQHILTDSGVREFKWKKLKEAKMRFAAENMCRFAVEYARQGLLRSDVLIWDTHDSRHGIQGRDDVANLQRMYYHLFSNVLRKRWPNEAIWRLHPDEHTAIEWHTIKDHLERKAAKVEIKNMPFSADTFSFRLFHEFHIEEIADVESQYYPLLQLSDFFAGMAVFSRENYSDYRQWLEFYNNQNSSPGKAKSVLKFSNSQLERFKVLQLFCEECKKHKLGVSLSKQKGFWTPKPQNPINFWFYVPQGEYDKAPRRKAKK